MPTVFLRQTDAVQIDADGVRTPAASKTIIRYNETAASALSSAASDANGVIAQGSITADVDDVIRYTHATLPGEFRLRAKATQAEAYLDTQYPATTYVMENLATLPPATDVDLYAVDTDNPGLPPVFLTSAKRNSTVEIPYQTTVPKNFDIYPVEKNKDRLTQLDIYSANKESIAITPTVGSGDITDGTGSSIDNEIPRYHSTTGKVLQGSGVTIDDTTRYIKGPKGYELTSAFGGTVLLQAPLTTGSQTFYLPTGSTSFITSGGTSQVVKQLTFGGPLTVGTLTPADLGMAEATNTEVLTGTDADKYLTPDGVAAIWEQGSDIASASTISVGEGGQFNITGTTPITDIDFATDRAGRTGWFKFAAAALLTVGAALILPGGQSITSAAGDIAAFRSEGSDVVRCISYQRAANFPRTQKEVYLEQFGHSNSGLAAAITAISTTATKLVVSENVTVSSSQTIPATCTLEIRNNAKITVSSSATLTISSFEDPGHVQCFAGVSSSNHVVFAAGTISQAKLAWYIGKSGGSLVNCTYAMNDLMTSATTNAGLTVKVLAGDWRVDNITIPSNTTIQGSGGGPAPGGSTGTIFKKYTASAGYIFNIGGLIRHIAIKDCVLDCGTNTNVYPFYAYNDTGQSGFGVYCENVTFSGSGSGGSVPLTIIDDSTNQWQLESVTFVNCQWIIPNDSTGFRCNGFNSNATFISCVFQSGTGSINAIHAQHMLGLKVIGCEFGGSSGAPSNTGATGQTINTTVSGTTATASAYPSTHFLRADIGMKFGSGTDRYIVGTSNDGQTATLSASGSNWSNTSTVIYRYTDGTRANVAIRCTDVGSVSIDNCLFEAFNYDFYFDNNLLDAPINFRDCYFMDRIHLGGSTIINSSGNHYNSLAFSDSVGSRSYIYSRGDAFSRYTVWNQQNSGAPVQLTTVKPWGPYHLGAGQFDVRMGYDATDYMTIGGRTQLIQEATDSQPNKALFRVGIGYYDTSTDGQILLEFITKNEYTQADEHGWNFRRSLNSVSSGYGRWVALQADAKYNSWTFGFGIGYDHTTRLNATQSTSRTTTVTLTDGCYHGYITLYSTGSLGPGASSIFQVNSNLVYAGDRPEVWVASGSTTDMVTATASKATANTFKVLVFNHSATTADSGTIVLGYSLWKGGGSLGV